MGGPNGPVPEGCIGFDAHLQPVCINETKNKEVIKINEK